MPHLMDRPGVGDQKLALREEETRWAHLHVDDDVGVLGCRLQTLGFKVVWSNRRLSIKQHENNNNGNSDTP